MGSQQRPMAPAPARRAQARPDNGASTSLLSFVGVQGMAGRDRARVRARDSRRVRRKTWAQTTRGETPASDRKPTDADLTRAHWLDGAGMARCARRPGRRTRRVAALAGACRLPQGRGGRGPGRHPARRLGECRRGTARRRRGSARRAALGPAPGRATGRWSPATHAVP
jgi:hypothetical protein